MGIDNLNKGIRGGRIISVNPLIVRVDNDGKDYNAVSELPSGTIAAGVRCNVANFGGRLTVVSVHGTTVPVTIESGRSPGSAPPQDTLTMTAGVTVVVYAAGVYTITLEEGMFLNDVIYAGITVWGSAVGSVDVLLANTSASAIDFYLQLGGTAVTSPQKISYMALGW